MSIDPNIASETVSVEELRLHYLTAGQGEPVLLLHGWPTSSFLWRNLISPLARTKRVIALDLPGFGRSDKPLGVSYSFRFYERVIDAFVTRLDLAPLNLVVHDLGGPLGLFWAIHNPAKIRRLALLNTLVFPEMSWAALAFVGATFVPLLRTFMTGPRGLEMAMRFGVEHKERLTPEIVAGYQAPFADRASREALLRTVQRLSPRGFKEIGAKLPLFKVPVRGIYGTADRILPDVAKTMRRVKLALPQTELTALPGCGHFLQEDEPEKIAELLAAFLDQA